MLGFKCGLAELVQPGTTSASQAEGRGFKSRTPHKTTIKYSLLISENFSYFVKFDISKLCTRCKHAMHRSYSISGMSWNQVYMHMWHFLSAFFSIMNSYQRRWRYTLHSSAYDSYTFEKVSVIHIGHFLNVQIMSLLVRVERGHQRVNHRFAYAIRQ